MFSPTVIEAPMHLEPVTSDTFIADLERPAFETSVRLAEQVAAAPRRRVFD